MLAIRLSRTGKKKQPYYRIIVSEKTKDVFGDFLEILGHYNPRSKVCDVKKDRILYWISKGAKPSPTVHNLLVDQKVIEAEKVKASKGKQKKSAAQKTATPNQPSSGDLASSSDGAIKPEEKKEDAKK